MTDINDVKGLIEFPWSYWIYIIAIVFLIIIAFYFLRKKWEEELIVEKKIYKKEDFLIDLFKMQNLASNNFDKKLWKKLSWKLKLFIADNYYKKIFFMSFWEIKNTQWLELLNNIFKQFDDEFYFYEKKSKKDFLTLNKEIKSILDWLKQ